MTVIEFKKKKKPENKVIIGIVILVILLIIFSLIRFVFSLRYRTTSGEPLVFFDRIEGKALLIRSEKVYFSNSSGNLEYMVDEGEKVAVGQEVVNVATANQGILDQMENIEKQLEELNINYYSDDENLGLLEDIQEKVIQEDYDGINQYLSKKISSEENRNLISDSLEALIQKYEELNKFVDSSYKINYSQDSGIISYEIDGLEGIIRPKEFENYTYDSMDLEKIKLEIDETSTINSVIGGNPIFKIIDDYIWHIALKVDNERILELEEGQAYDIELTEGKILIGRIININRDNYKGVVVIEFKEGLHEFYKDRILNASLIKSQTNVYKIPSDCIIQKDGQDGLYINHIYGLVRFVPVNIIDKDDDITYVEQGNNNGNITLDGKEIKTITKFDEIFLRPTNLEENQILK